MILGKSVISLGVSSVICTGTQGMENVLNTVPRKVTGAMNAGLTKPYEESVVKTALFQMYPMKAPGPNGFPAYFFSAIGSFVDKR
jgi:hypothetical protein